MSLCTLCMEVSGLPGHCLQVVVGWESVNMLALCNTPLSATCTSNADPNQLLGHILGFNLVVSKPTGMGVSDESTSRLSRTLCADLT